MRLLMVAPPGAGKGTQGAVIAEHFGIPHIATGDLLREHVAQSTELGVAVKAYLDRGELVPDDVVLAMVRVALEAARGGGWVLDGVPRTMQQARALYALARELGMTADVVGRHVLTALEVMRQMIEGNPGAPRTAIDLTGLGAAFGEADGSPPGT